MNLPRTRIHNGLSVCAADLADVTNEFVLLCASGVDLYPLVESVVSDVLRNAPDTDLAYFDGCRRLDSAAEAMAEHRPAFSPDRLRSQMYLGDVLLVRTSLLRRVLTEGDTDGAIDLPLGVADANRIADRCRVITHVPRIVARMAPQQRAPFIDLRPQMVDRTPVSIIICTNGSEREVWGRTRTLVVHAVNSLIARTAYEAYEIVVVLTPGSSPDLPDQIMQVASVHGQARRPPVRFCRDSRPFNFSNACNRGSAIAAGEVLVFLNDDTEVQSSDWLDQLVRYAVRPDVGAVGGRLLYEDGTIQHAGIWSRGGFPSHRYVGFPNDHHGHLDSLTVPQNCLAVTGACLAVETSKFEAAGGFCPGFPSSYNDVDLCLKLDMLGYRTVVVPDAVLVHFESSSREPTIGDDDFALLQKRWNHKVVDDCYDNPNHLAPESNEYPVPDVRVTMARDASTAARWKPRRWQRDERSQTTTTSAGVT